MNEDEDDYVFFGTPIEREEDTSARKRKAIADAGQLRSLPAWKQEVRDDEGRRRFHGAFTGGFSAGYYNTAGSKEGWTPQTFTSSRKNRAEPKQQCVYNFLDDEDIKDMGGHALETSSQFDTFGFTSAEAARKQAEKEQQKRPSAIPGLVPDEIVLPAANSIGVKLLLKMGWRRGHSIRETHAGSLYDARREARKALLAFSGNEVGSEPSETVPSTTDSEDYTGRYKNDLHATQSTPVYVLCPKQDLHGLGYDPYKHAPEFRDRKRLHDSKNKGQGSRTELSEKGRLLASNSGKYAPGFGIGALEELDVEDEDIYASGFEYVGMEVEEDEPSRAVMDKKHKLEPRKQDVLSGFKVASCSDYDLERFRPPVIPPDFEPFHKFTCPLETVNKFAEAPPPEVPPPEDNSMKLLIDGFATLVARCGKLFEDLSKEKNRSNPLFSFLSCGNGHSYYARKLWEAKESIINQQNQVDMKSTSADQKMTAESRGRILGEKPLERSFIDSASSAASKEVIAIQSNLTDTFTKPASRVAFSERAKPFKDDHAKQERFEQFLKDKYEGGLRSKYSGGTASMSESARARERLDFEAAAEAIEKGEWNMKTNLPATQHIGVGDSRFTSSTGVEKQHISQDEETVIDKVHPKREEFQWRPSPILCKRFDLIDPFMGKPPPMPRARSKLDALFFVPDSVVNVNNEEADAARRDSLPTTRSEQQEQPTLEEPDIQPNATSVQRPVDLYKAIFSDESDDEGDNASFDKVQDPEKKTEGVNTTLNRLIAGDFLESLGKELGLEVPMDTQISVNMTNNFPSITEPVDREDTKTSSRNDKSAPTLQAFHTQFDDQRATASLEIARESKLYSVAGIAGKEGSPTDLDGPSYANSRSKYPGITSLNKEADDGLSDRKEGKIKEDKKESRARKHRAHSRHHRSSSTSSTDYSSHGDYDRSKSRSEKRDSAKGKSRKHSKHHRHKSRSPMRYSGHGKDRDMSDDGRKDRRSRDREKHGRQKYR